MHTRIPMEHTASSKGRQDGIVLVEVLISVLLFSLGIPALVGLQALMSKNVTEAKLRSESAFLANQLIGQMWVDQANLPSYAMTAGACTDNDFAGCLNWRSRVQELLPAGSAEVTVNGTAVNIQLSWTLPGEAPGQFEVDANITN